MVGFCVQMFLVFATGVPIFVLFPVLICRYIVRDFVKSGFRGLKNRIALPLREMFARQVSADDMSRPHRFSHWEGSAEQKEAETSLYWRHRFTFAVTLWMSFIAFISADFSVQAAPIPWIACALTDTSAWSLKADERFECFSGEMGVPHVAGAGIASVFVMLFPAFVYWKINRVSWLNSWHDKDCMFQMGYFYGYYKQQWCYLYIMNHLNLCVLVTVSNLIFWQDEQAMAIVPILLHVLYLALILLHRPFEEGLDNILEVILVSVNIFGFVLSLIQLHDPESVFIEV